MLERNVCDSTFLFLDVLTSSSRSGQPRKDKILQKHEFTGNRSVPEPHDGSGDRANLASGSGGRGRGGGRGGDRGRGRGGARVGGNEMDQRERAWKDKNKASRGNHNRKRGHDKKIARAGGPS